MKLVSKVKRSLLVKENGGASGAESLLIGVMLLMILLFIGMFSIMQNTYSARFEMLDGNLTASLLGVAKADLGTYGDTNIIQIDGSSADILNELSTYIGTNFEDDNLTDGPYRITNETLFGTNGYMLIEEVVIVNKGTVTEPLNDNEIAFGKYTMTSDKYTLAGNAGVYTMNYAGSLPVGGGVQAGAWDWALNLPAVEKTISTAYTLDGKTYSGIEDCTVGIKVSMHYDMGGKANFIGTETKTRDADVSRTRVVQVKRNNGH